LKLLFFLQHHAENVSLTEDLQYLSATRFNGLANKDSTILIQYLYAFIYTPVAVGRGRHM